MEDLAHAQRQVALILELAGQCRPVTTRVAEPPAAGPIIWVCQNRFGSCGGPSYLGVSESFSRPRNVVCASCSTNGTNTMFQKCVLLSKCPPRHTLIFGTSGDSLAIGIRIKQSVCSRTIFAIVQYTSEGGEPMHRVGVDLFSHCGHSASPP